MGQDWVLLILLGSALLNAAYFLPLLYRGWFGKPPVAGWKVDHFAGQRLETHWMLLLPALFTALLSLLVGIFAGSVLSPLGWSEFIIIRQFTQ
jgi:multicomponent Na+:H+ antiporter subunit D